MDCADEAALIRHALARPGVESLNFDLVGRRVDVANHKVQGGAEPRRAHAAVPFARNASTTSQQQ